MGRREHPRSVRINGETRTVERWITVRGQQFGWLGPLGSRRDRFLLVDPGRRPGGGLCVLHHYERTPEAWERVRILAGLNDSRFPRIVRYEAQENRIRVVVDWIAGQTLEEYLQAIRQGALPRVSPYVAVRMVRSLAHAVAHLHSALNVIHGDIKPANIVVTDGQLTNLRLIDFGSAWSVERSVREAGRGDGVTFDVYAAPEQRREVLIPDFRSDMFSVGVIGYELLTGQIPYGGMGGGAGATPAFQAEFAATWVAPSQFRLADDITPRAIWQRLDRILARSLALSSDERFENESEWVSDIDDVYALSLQKPTLGQVHDSRRVGLGFGNGKHPTRVPEINVARLDDQRFLGAATGFPGDQQKFAEVGIWDEGEHVLPLCVGDHPFALATRRLFKVHDRRLVDVALLLGPRHGPHDRAAEVSLGTAGKLRIAVNPLLDVKRFEMGHQQIRVARHEQLQPGLVPLVRGRRAVVPRELEEGVDEDGDRISADSPLRGRSAHEFMVCGERREPVGAEIVLGAVDLDVPQLAALAEKRFRMMRHDRTFP